jgi:hypothetical protein
VLLIQSEADKLLVVCMQGVDLLETPIFHLEQQFLHRFLSSTIKQSNKYIQRYKTVNYHPFVLSAKIFLQMKIIQGVYVTLHTDSEIPNHMQ